MNQEEALNQRLRQQEEEPAWKIEASLLKGREHDRYIVNHDLRSPDSHVAALFIVDERDATWLCDYLNGLEQSRDRWRELATESYRLHTSEGKYWAEERDRWLAKYDALQQEEDAQ